MRGRGAVGGSDREQRGRGRGHRCGRGRHERVHKHSSSAKWSDMIAALPPSLPPSNHTLSWPFSSRHVFQRLNVRSVRLRQQPDGDEIVGAKLGLSWRYISRTTGALYMSIVPRKPTSTEVISCAIGLWQVSRFVYRTLWRPIESLAGSYSSGLFPPLILLFLAQNSCHRQGRNVFSTVVHGFSTQTLVSLVA